MKTIYKQRLEIYDRQKVMIQQDFRVLHLGEQDGHACMWFECTADAPMKEIEVLCFGTGHPMPDRLDLRYIGTVATCDGRGIWHFYLREE